MATTGKGGGYIGSSANCWPPFDTPWHLKPRKGLDDGSNGMPRDRGLIRSGIVVDNQPTVNTDRSPLAAVGTPSQGVAVGG